MNSKNKSIFRFLPGRDVPSHTEMCLSSSLLLHSKAMLRQYFMFSAPDFSLLKTPVNIFIHYYYVGFFLKFNIPSTSVLYIALIKF